jgi:hypothetical protein
LEREREGNRWLGVESMAEQKLLAFSLPAISNGFILGGPVIELTVEEMISKVIPWTKD